MTLSKLQLIANINKALIAAVSGSLIATDHPYVTIAVMAIGGITNEVIEYLKSTIKNIS